MNLFDLGTQYQIYLQRVGLSEANMATQQKIETKRAFMGACGQMMHLLTEGCDELTEQEALPLLSGLFAQVDSFWQGEVITYNQEVPIKPSANDIKAKKWDALDAEISQCYYDENGEEHDEAAGGDLAEIGELAARAFGYMDIIY